MIEYTISQEKVVEIQTLNAKLVAIKNLYKEALLNEDTAIADKLGDKLASVQIAYDAWFDKMTLELEAKPNPNQSWQVDFGAKKMYLVG